MRQLNRPKYRERFPDRINDDRDAYFDAFGEEHEVFKQRIIIVLDDYDLAKRQVKQGIQATEFFIANSQLHFFAKCEDLPKRKNPGERFEFDGRVFDIDEWLIDEGIAEIRASISTRY